MKDLRELQDLTMHDAQPIGDVVGVQSHGHQLRVRDPHHVSGGHRKVTLFSMN